MTLTTGDQVLLAAIDGNEANIKNRVGINQFAFGVLWGMYKLRAKKVKPQLKFTIFLAEKPRPDLPPETSWWRYEVFGPKRFWTWTGLVKRLYCGKPKPDILLSLSHYGPGFSPIPFIVSIMDLGFLRWPEQFTKKDFYQLKYWTAWGAKRAKKIITISKFSKNNIAKTYGIDPKKIVVAYPGYKKIQNSPSAIGSASGKWGAGKLKTQNYKAKLKAVGKKYKIANDYIFYLGTIKPSKNIEGLVKAFDFLIKKNPSMDLGLVVAGKKGWLYKDVFRLVKKLKLEKKVIFTGFVSDEEASLLMRGAKIFVLPSFWEGFGIPILEAMGEGTPVVCSNKGALPEVAGEAALLVNPNNPKDIAKKIGQALADNSACQDLIKKGQTRVKMFSWEKCSKIILRELIAGSNAQK